MGEVGAVGHSHAMAAEGPTDRGEVVDGEIDAAVRQLPLALLLLDQGEASIDEDHDNRGEAEFRGGGEFARDHQEPGIPGEGDDLAAGIGDLRAEGERDGTAHGAEPGRLQQHVRCRAGPDLRQEDPVRAAVHRGDPVRGQRGAADIDDRGRPPDLVGRKGADQRHTGRRDLASGPGRAGRSAVGQRGERRRHPGCEGNGRAVHVGQPRHRGDIDDCLGAGVPDVLPAGPHLDRVIAGQKDEVGRAEERQKVAVGQRRKSRPAKRKRVVLGHEPLGAVGGDDRHAMGFGECADCPACVFVQRIDPGKQDRPFGPGERGPGAVEIGPRRRCGRRGEGAADRAGQGRRICRLHRHVDMDRARLRLAGKSDRAVGDHLGRRGGQAQAGLGDRAEYRGVVEDLMRVAFGGRGFDTAGQHDQRHTLLPGVLDGIDGIQRAGPEGCDQNPRRAGPVPVPFGHEAAGILVLDQDEVDPGPFERIDQCQHLAPRHAEGLAAARFAQPPGKDVCGTDRVGHRELL